MPVSSSRAVLFFLLIAFGFSWSVAELYFRFGRDSDIPYALMGVIYMYGPALAALATTKWLKKAPLTTLGPIWRWHLGLLPALLAPAIFALLALAVSGLLPGVDWVIDSSSIVEKITNSVPAEKRADVMAKLDQMGAFLSLSLILSVAASSVIAGATVNAIAAFGEELGWRGFLQKHWQAKGFWLASFSTGAMWGLWHLPLVLRGHNYPDHPQWGVFMMTLFCMLLSPLMAWWQQRTETLLAPIFFHGALNATGGLMLFVSGSSLLVGITGLAGILVLIVANIVLYWRLKKATLVLTNPLLETA